MVSAMEEIPEDWEALCEEALCEDSSTSSPGSETIRVKTTTPHNGENTMSSSGSETDRVRTETQVVDEISDGPREVERTLTKKETDALAKIDRARRRCNEIDPEKDKSKFAQAKFTLRQAKFSYHEAKAEAEKPIEQTGGLPVALVPGNAIRRPRVRNKPSGTDENKYEWLEQAYKTDSTIFMNCRKR